MTEDSTELFRGELLSLDPNQELKVCDSVDPVYVDLALKFTEGDLEFMPLLIEVMFNVEEAHIVNELPAPAEEIAGKLNITSISNGMNSRSPSVNLSAKST